MKRREVNEIFRTQFKCRKFSFYTIFIPLPFSDIRVTSRNFANICNKWASKSTPINNGSVSFFFSRFCLLAKNHVLSISSQQIAGQINVHLDWLADCTLLHMKFVQEICINKKVLILVDSKKKSYLTPSLFSHNNPLVACKKSFFCKKLGFPTSKAERPYQMVWSCKFIGKLLRNTVWIEITSINPRLLDHRSHLDRRQHDR